MFQLMVTDLLVDCPTIWFLYLSFHNPDLGKISIQQCTTFTFTPSQRPSIFNFYEAVEVGLPREWLKNASNILTSLHFTSLQRPFDNDMTSPLSHLGHLLLSDICVISCFPRAPAKPLSHDGEIQGMQEPRLLRLFIHFIHWTPFIRRNIQGKNQPKWKKNTKNNRLVWRPFIRVWLIDFRIFKNNLTPGLPRNIFFKREKFDIRALFLRKIYMLCFVCLNKDYT